MVLHFPLTVILELGGNDGVICSTIFSIAQDIEILSARLMEGLQPSIYRGVVPMKNGKWGSQISIERKRIWLGTYSSEVDAALAYDRANYSLETIISMIKRGTYPGIFSHFLRSKESNDHVAWKPNVVDFPGSSSAVGLGHGPIKLFGTLLG